MLINYSNGTYRNRRGIKPNYRVKYADGIHLIHSLKCSQVRLVFLVNNPDNVCPKTIFK